MLKNRSVKIRIEEIEQIELLKNNIVGVFFLLRFGCVVLLFSITTSCCSVYPVKSESFESEAGFFCDRNSDNKACERYSVGDSLIDVSVYGDDWEKTDRFSIFVTVNNLDEIKDKIIIHNMIVKTNGQINDNYIIEYRRENEVEIPLMFPIEIIHSTNPEERDITFSTSDIDVKFSMESKIEVQLDLEVIKKTSRDRGIINYYFYPRVNWNPIQCLSV